VGRRPSASARPAAAGLQVLHVHQWVREPAVSREGLLALLTDLLERLLRYPARDWGARSPASPAGGCSRPTTSEALAPVASIDFFTVAP
jgi:hypothetical protein